MDPLAVKLASAVSQLRELSHLSLPPTLPRLDVLVVFSKIRNEVTQLGLALKGPGVEYGIALALVVRIMDGIEGLKLQLDLPATEPGDGGGNKLSRELSYAISSILLSLCTLFSTISASLVAPSSTAKASRQLLLQSTAKVWETIDLLSETSGTNLQANGKEWRGVLELMEDCLSELKEGLAAAEEEGGAAVELGRSKVVIFIVRLGVLLLQRLLTTTTPTFPAISLTGYESLPNFLDPVWSAISGLSEGCDDLAAALESTQDAEEVQRLTVELVDALKTISGLAEGAYDTTGGGEGTKELLWQSTLRKQLDREVVKLKSLGLE